MVGLAGWLWLAWLVNLWLMVGGQVGYGWFMVGQCLVNGWLLFGQWLAHVSSMLG